MATEAQNHYDDEVAAFNDDRPVLQTEDEVRAHFGVPDTITGGSGSYTRDDKVVYQADYDLCYDRLLPHWKVLFPVVAGRIMNVIFVPKPPERVGDGES